MLSARNLNRNVFASVINARGTRSLKIDHKNLIIEGLNKQAEHCLQNLAPITAKIVKSFIPMMDNDAHMIGKTLANWQGNVLEDAVGLRVAGSLHNLHLTRKEKRLGDIYNGNIYEQND